MEQFPDDYECEGQIDIWEWMEEKETQSMTREEAIEELKRDIHNAKVTHHLSDHYEMAIKALSTERCEDYISRAELLKAVDTWDKFGCDANTKLVPYKDHYIPYIHYDDVIKAIKGMPSVHPKPKTGHWVSILNKKGLEIAVRCDCCGNSPKHAIRSDFCPNCGAKMVESQESEGK